MDKSPAEAMHSGNMTFEEMESEVVEFLQKCLDEKENSASSLHADLDRVARKREPPLIQINEKITSPPAEERRAHDPIHSLSFLRRKFREEEIALEKEMKKMEQVWSHTIRELPVDRETVCSDSSEDAFDVENLSESLPSTSASVNKQKVNGTFTRQKDMLIKTSSSLSKRLLRMKRHEHNRRQRVSRSPSSERIPSASNSVKEIITSELVLQVWRDIKRERRRLGKDDSFISKSELDVLRAAQLYEDLPMPRSHAQTSTDDKQDEKDNERQNSDAENHLPRPGLNVLPLLTNDVSKLAIKMEQSGWDTEKKRTMKFHFPGVPAPLNSPVKKENADKNDPLGSRQKDLRCLRKEKLLEIQDSLRELLREDSSGNDEPASEGVSQTMMDKSKYIDLVRRMKESVRKDRPIRCPRSRRIVKSKKGTPN